MKYHPHYFKYAKKDYVEFVEMVNADRCCIECFNDFLSVCLGYFLVVAIPTFLAPFMAIIYYFEWRKTRKPLTEEFIEQL